MIHEWCLPQKLKSQTLRRFLIVQNMFFSLNEIYNILRNSIMRTLSLNRYKDFSNSMYENQHRSRDVIKCLCFIYVEFKHVSLSESLWLGKFDLNVDNQAPINEFLNIKPVIMMHLVITTVCVYLLIVNTCIWKLMLSVFLYCPISESLFVKIFIIWI